MGFTFVVSLAVVWSTCHAQNNTVRYEPLKNKDVDAENQAWENGTEYYVRSYGLSFEWLETTTDDNVTLKIHHIWNPKVKGTRIPVLLLPTLGASGDVFLLNRPEGNFMMTLANQGYDVFLANQRGCPYSPIPSHRFEQTTLDDYALLDVPPTVDKVLNFTNQQKLHLIGCSRGTTVALTFLANKVEYNDKIRLLFLMGPVTYMEKPKWTLAFLLNLLRVAVLIGGKDTARIFDTNFFFEILHRDSVPEKAQYFIERVPVLPNCIMNFVFGKFDCFSKIYIDPTIVKKSMIRGWPEHMYLRELIQYAQNTMAKKYQSYSPGWINRDFLPLLFDVYPTTKAYRMQNVKCPVTILEAETELFSQPQDYQRIRNELCSNIISGEFFPKKYALQVKTPNYNHIDIMIARNNDRFYAKAFYMIMREFDISLDESQQNVLGYIDADFSHLVPQPCE